MYYFNHNGVRVHSLRRCSAISISGQEILLMPTCNGLCEWNFNSLLWQYYYSCIYYGYQVSWSNQTYWHAISLISIVFPQEEVLQDSSTTWRIVDRLTKAIAGGAYKSHIKVYDFAVFDCAWICFWWTFSHM